MGKEKAGALTPKAIANRIKAKGLQKLRWYCQMCQKQCRDENGFKCHCMSESHQRQLLLFAENPNKYLDSFSQDFFDDFIKLLSRCYGTRRVHCNIVYQEYVSDRDHTHMNATQWETLTDFVKWLGREGHCTVDETEKGWYITYIDKDPLVVARQKAAESKEKRDMDDQERMEQFVERQIERAKTTHGAQDQTEFTELQREDDGEKVAFNFAKPGPSRETKSDRSKLDPPKVLDNLLKKPMPKTSSKETTKRKSALDEILEEEAAKKKKFQERQENWVTKGIVVKVMTKKLGDKYFKRKGVIKDVKNLFVAVVEMLDNGDMLKLDQTNLETVIPAPGKALKVLNGPYRGHIATMIDIDEKSFCVTVKLKKEGSSKGEIKVPYEDVSKLAS